ncbi:hypothetical protein H1220_01515 [Carnobacteriaceae bacterium zg-84]|uniref:hypothetical protein n=1 Tax=Granulicatella sp. zg-84 TaxID=2678503 RepID=UPI0017768242|nr:hypothetical protein [Granulicatella sp. zg-84]QMI86078.1 hypothetical protein H1220_01515 [Carnobacteriaceae bacterium zg-84]
MIYPRKTKPITSTEKRPPRKANAFSIEQRPQEINERKTRYEIIRLIPDKTAQSVNTTLTSIQQDYFIQSLTAHNGSEFLRLDEAITCPIYDAHPFSSYERGTNKRPYIKWCW